MAGCATATIRRLLELDGVPQRPSYRRPPPESGITREWLEREYTVKLRSIETLSRERGVTACYLMSLARNWGAAHPSSQPVQRHRPLGPARTALTRHARRHHAQRSTGPTRADHPHPGPRQHRCSSPRPLRRPRQRPGTDAPQDRNGRRIHYHRPIRQAAAPHDGRPRVHPGSVPDPPDRSGARGPTGLPAGGRPES